MRILHVSPYFVPAYGFGGPVKAVHELCRTLVRKGHDAEVITTDGDVHGRLDVPRDRFVEIDGVRVRYAALRLRRAFVSPDQVRWIRREAPRFDLIHIHGIYSWGTPAAARMARRSGRPYVISPRGMLLREAMKFKSGHRKRLFVDLLAARALDGAAAIHYTTEEERRDSYHRGRVAPGFVVPNGIDPAEYAHPVGANPLVSRWPRLLGKRVVLSLGRLDPKKGLELLIDAYASIAGRDESVHLLVAGTGARPYEQRLRRLVAERGMLDRVDFTGLLTGAQKLWALHMADVFVLTSYSENFGMAVLEALCCGKPVVVTEPVNLAAEVRDHQTGLVARCEVRSIADAIERLLQQPDDRRAMGARAQRLVRDRFTWDTVGEQMLRTYAELVGACRPRALV